jgi:hypothetical protein
MKFVGFLLLSLIRGGSFQKLTNIDYIGLGYDVIMGNPHSDLYDRGFKQSVMELTYQQVRRLFLIGKNINCISSVLAIVN